MKIILAVAIAIVVPGGLIVLALAFLSKRLVSSGRLPSGKLQKLLKSVSWAWKPAYSQAVPA